MGDLGQAAAANTLRGLSWGCLGVGTRVFGISLAEACSGHNKTQKDPTPWNPNEPRLDSRDRNPRHKANALGHFDIFDESESNEAKRQRRRLIEIHPAFAALRTSSKTPKEKAE